MQLILRKIIKFFLFLTALIKLKSIKWAFRVSLEKLSIRDLESLFVKNGNLIHNETGMILSDEIYLKIKGGLLYWKSLAAYTGIHNILIENDNLIIKIDHSSFLIDHPGTLFVLDEIFHEKLYDLRVNEELIVLDIGMNVGIASVYFSIWENVEKVYGFEPLPATYQQAMKNIQLNPDISDKIVLQKKGVGETNGKLKVPFDKGGSAVFSTNDDFIRTIGIASKDLVEVEIISIYDVVEEIRLKHPGKRILLKLDCEGEEYNILNRLDADHLLNNISCIAMEWHFKGYESLCSILQKNGFSIFNLGRKEIRPPVGMIYAFNMNRN